MMILKWFNQRKAFLHSILNFLRWFWIFQRNLKAYPVKVDNFETTVKKIVNRRLSVARFGDGELRLMLQADQGGTFEVNSRDLAVALKSLLKSKQPNLLVCLPTVYDYQMTLKFSGKTFWIREVGRFLPQYYDYLDHNYLYGDAFFTRPYRDQQISYGVAKQRFEQVRDIWQERPVLMVEGELTRFGMGNDLLNNARSVDRILAPATNAFERLDDIILSIERYLEDVQTEDLLVLIALGPSATVLAGKLTKKFGIQSIDIGHLDIEYEWFLRHATEKVAIAGKYVNESATKKYVEGKVDVDYTNSIVDRVS